MLHISSRQFLLVTSSVKKQTPGNGSKEKTPRGASVGVRVRVRARDLCEMEWGELLASADSTSMVNLTAGADREGGEL